MQRVKVGRRPTAVRTSPGGHTAFIANTFDDSISMLDLAAKSIVATISLGPQPELSLAQRGELLFHDARLSHDGWMSCQSCHTDGHANGQMNDNFSDRSFGAPKRVLSLLGVKDTLPLAWSGQVQTLERQIHNSVENTMQREETLPRNDVQAIAAYVETLELPPPLDVLRGTEDRAAIERGRLIFEHARLRPLPRAADLHLARRVRRGPARCAGRKGVQSTQSARFIPPRAFVSRQPRRDHRGCLSKARTSESIQSTQPTKSPTLSTYLRSL